MGFKKGSDSIEQAVKEEAAARASGKTRLDYFSIKPDDGMVFLRFLTDNQGWYRTKQHEFIITKAAPAGMKEPGKWPKAMSAICRRDPEIAGDYPDGCYICDNKLAHSIKKEFTPASSKVWALAVMREQILGDGTPEFGGPDKLGKPVGMGDVSESYEVKDKDGNVVESGHRAKIVVVNMAWKNFFSAVHHTALVNRTVCDRDFAVRRTGTGTETTYNITPLDKVDGLEPGTEMWVERYLAPLEKREISLEGILESLVSDEHLARWFDPTVEVDKDGKIVPAGKASSDGGTGGSSGAAPLPDVDTPDEKTQAQLASLKSRLEGGSKVAAPTA